jgi:hypothetical protein
LKKRCVTVKAGTWIARTQGWASADGGFSPLTTDFRG